MADNGNDIIINNPQTQDDFQKLTDLFLSFLYAAAISNIMRIAVSKQGPFSWTDFGTILFIVLFIASDWLIHFRLRHILHYSFARNQYLLILKVVLEIGIIYALNLSLSYFAQEEISVSQMTNLTRNALITFGIFAGLSHVWNLLIIQIIKEGPLEKETWWTLLKYVANGTAYESDVAKQFFTKLLDYKAQIEQIRASKSQPLKQLIDKEGISLKAWWLIVIALIQYALGIAAYIFSKIWLTMCAQFAAIHSLIVNLVVGAILIYMGVHKMVVPFVAYEDGIGQIVSIVKADWPWWSWCIALLFIIALPICYNKSESIRYVIIRCRQLLRRCATLCLLGCIILIYTSLNPVTIMVALMVEQVIVSAFVQVLIGRTPKPIGVSQPVLAPS